MKRSLLTLVALVFLAGVASAQTTMTQIFKVDVAGTLSWFVATDTTRGMAFNPVTGHLLVASRGGSSQVHILDAATGAELGTLNNTLFGPGNHPVSKVACASDGTIYVSNLAITGANYVIFKFANETAVPTKCVDTASSPKRQGDSISVVGTGTSTKLLVNGFTGFAGGFYIYTTADGNTFTGSEITPTGDPSLLATTNQYSQWDTDGVSYWVSKLQSNMDDATSPGLFNSSNVMSREDRITSVAGGGFAVVNMTINGGPQKLIGFEPASASSTLEWEQYGRIYQVEPTSGMTQLLATGSLAPASPGGVVNPNGNGTGDVCFDTAGRKVYMLYTNNSISGWNIPTTADVSDWIRF